MNSSKKAKRWSLSGKKAKSDELAELGIAVLETDEILNLNSESSEINPEMLNDDEWEYATSLIKPESTSAAEVTPSCCPTIDNKENTGKYVEKKTYSPVDDKIRTRQSSVADDFNIIRRREPTFNENAPGKNQKPSSHFYPFMYAKATR